MESQTTTTEDLNRNKTVVRRILEAFNTGDAGIIDEVADPSLFSHTPFPRTNAQQGGLKQQVRRLREHFPNAYFEEEAVVAEGDQVFMQWKMTVTVPGQPGDQAQAGEQRVHHGHELIRLKDGKIIEHQTLVRGCPPMGRRSAERPAEESVTAESYSVRQNS